jgi:hypothetical protein
MSVSAVRETPYCMPQHPDRQDAFVAFFSRLRQPPPTRRPRPGEHLFTPRKDANLWTNTTHRLRLGIEPLSGDESRLPIVAKRTRCHESRRRRVLARWPQLRWTGCRYREIAGDVLLMYSGKSDSKPSLWQWSGSQRYFRTLKRRSFQDSTTSGSKERPSRSRQSGQ